MAAQRRSQEERDAEIAQLKATLDAAVERIASAPDQWVEFLDVVAQFGARYSFGNQLLILAQCAERGIYPTMVRPYGSRDTATGKPRAGYAGGWLGLGRHVIAGEKALKIWRPILKRYTEEEAAAHQARTGHRIPRDARGRLPRRVVSFGVASVFDISQTDGDPVDVPTVTVTRRSVAPGGARPELLTGEDTTGAQAAVEDLITGEGFRFALVPRAMLATANGRTNFRTRDVQVRDDVDPAQRFKTTVHELAHIWCGHGEDGFDYIEHRGRAETEAESVAYVVAGALGLNTEPYSAPYVAGWCEGDMQLVARAADTVVTTARRILAALDDNEAKSGRTEESTAA